MVLLQSHTGSSVRSRNDQNDIGILATSHMRALPGLASPVHTGRTCLLAWQIAAGSNIAESGMQSRPPWGCLADSTGQVFVICSPIHDRCCFTACRGTVTYPSPNS